MDEVVDTNVGTFGTTAERFVQQQVHCELRNGSAFFVFRAPGYGVDQIAIHADTHLALLTHIRKNPVNPNNLAETVGAAMREKNSVEQAVGHD